MTRRELLAAPLSLALRGSILVHEHVLVDFVGADSIRRGRYDPDEVFRIAKEKLTEVERLGCRRLQECTPNYLGRDPKLLARLANTVGIEIWTNTGLYGAANYKFVPRFAWQESAEQLAARWIAEARRGIEGIKPRFIKTGVNLAPLGELDRKLVRAAAIASRETGLAIASHTGDGMAALEQLHIVEDPAKFVWVHAQREKEHAFHEKVARAGAWVEFDGVNATSAAWHLECLRFMAENKLLKRTLISQDSGWYHVDEPGGGEYRGYTYIYTDFLPRLDTQWVRQLMLDNPLKAFG